MLSRHIDFTGATPLPVLHEAELDDIVNEINQQQDDPKQLNNLALVGYGVKQIDLNKPSTSVGSTRYYELFRHNLSYRPLCLVWYFSPAENLYYPIPVLFLAVALDIVVATNVSHTTDNSVLYATWMGQAQQPNQQFYYFVFKNPAIQ